MSSSTFNGYDYRLGGGSRKILTDKYVRDHCFQCVGVPNKTQIQLMQENRNNKKVVPRNPIVYQTSERNHQNLFDVNAQVPFAYASQTSVDPRIRHAMPTVNALNDSLRGIMDAIQIQSLNQRAGSFITLAEYTERITALERAHHEHLIQIAMDNDIDGPETSDAASGRTPTSQISALDLAQSSPVLRSRPQTVQAQGGSDPSNPYAIRFNRVGTPMNPDLGGTSYFGVNTSPSNRPVTVGGALPFPVDAES